MLLPGSRLGDYEVVAHLGSGSFGAVYQGKNKADGCFFALKLCRLENPEFQLLRRLQHPGIVSVVEEFTCLHGYVTVMNLIEGQPLAAWLAAVHRQPRRRLRVRDVRQRLPEAKDGSRPDATRSLLKTNERFISFGCRIGLEVARALEHAHSRKIYHGDVKPENILVTEQGAAVLIDWGIAAGSASDDAVAGGTLSYMRTEALEVVAGLRPKSSEGGSPAKQRDDIFALGIVLHELVVGDLPLPAPEMDSSIVAAARESLARRSTLTSVIATNPAIPEGLKPILVACLCSDHDAKQTSFVQYCKMEQVIEDLQCYVRHLAPIHVSESWHERIRRCVRRGRVLWIGFLFLTTLLISSFAIDRYQTSNRLLAVDEFRRQIADVETTDAVVPADIRQAPFQRGLFADSDTLRHQRARVGHGLAAACLARGETETAVSLLEEIVLLIPADGEVYNDLGVARFQLRDFELAVAAFDQAMELDCDRSAVLSNRGAALAAMGKFDEARQDFQQAIEIDPENEAAEKHLELLNRISGQIVQ